MQVVVTSYCRLMYLRRTVESLRQDPIQLFIVDGGSDRETREYIGSVADACVFFENNPGADYLKTEGIRRFITDREFLISSDDIVYPAGYSAQILENYRRINRDKLEWTFCACNMPEIEAQPDRHRFITVKGVEILPVATCQVFGAILDRKTCEQVGYFPVYGKSGQGDWAFSKRLRNRGIKMGYWRRPMAEHIGRHKRRDYPEYTRMYDEDAAKWMQIAKRDRGQP